MAVSTIEVDTKFQDLPLSEKQTQAANLIRQALAPLTKAQRQVVYTKLTQPTWEALNQNEAVTPQSFQRLIQTWLKQDREKAQQLALLPV